MTQATVKHYGAASSAQRAEAMYVQLYRSKVQFHRKFGGARESNRFKRLLWIAYAPRLIATSVCAPFSPQIAGRARTYHRLLAELAEM